MPQGSPLTFKEICMEIYWFLNQPVRKKPSKRGRPSVALAQEGASVDQLIATMQRGGPARERRAPFGTEGATGSRSGDKQPFILEGELHYAVRTICSIHGEEFIVSPKTWVVGNMEEGSHARVKGVIKKGEKYATNIVIGKAVQSAGDGIQLAP